MTVVIPPEQIKEISQELDGGLKCFYHIATGEVKSYPDEFKGHAGFEEEFWKDIMEQVESAPQDFVAFESLESFESFKMMETFINTIEEVRIQLQFEDVIHLKKPFQQFKYLLYDYPVLREQWFDFKNHYLMEHVEQQLKSYNLLNSLKND
jgi:hypothetical protein